jgi:hypothetical protein
MHPHEYEDEDDSRDDGEPLAREDFATRKGRRLRDVKEERRDHLITGFSGLVMLVMGIILCRVAGVNLSRGWMELDTDDIVYAAQEPGWFYFFVGMMAAMGLFAGQLGARMLLHMRREMRRTARLARRVARAGTRRQ